LCHRQILFDSDWRLGYAMIDAPDTGGQSFAEVPENHFELGILIEQAAAHQTQRVNRSFSPESPRRTDQPRMRGCRYTGTSSCWTTAQKERYCSKS